MTIASGALGRGAIARGGARTAEARHVPPNRLSRPERGAGSPAAGGHERLNIDKDEGARARAERRMLEAGANGMGRAPPHEGATRVQRP